VGGRLRPAALALAAVDLGGGGDVLCPGGRRASGCLDASATMAAIRWYGDWVTRWGIAPRPHDPRASGVEIARLFAAGRIAFMTVGHDAVRGLRASVAAGRMRVGFALIPHRAGLPPATVLYATGYAVPARALRRKAGVELAVDLTDSLPDAARGDAGIELPAVTAAAQAWRRPTRSAGRRRSCEPPRTAGRGGERASPSGAKWRPSSPT